MKRLPIAFALGAILLPLPVQAQTEHRWSFDLGFGGLFGYTDYDMTFDEDYFGSYEGIPIDGLRSRLEFPLSTPLLTAEATLDVYSAGERTSFYSLELSKDLGNPAGLMYDHDWIRPVGSTWTQFSYTESELEGNLLGINLTGGWRIWKGHETALFAAAAYRFLYIHQDILGYAGWQISDTPNPDLYPPDDELELYAIYAPDSLRVLEYWVLYNMPSAGLTFEFEPSDVFRASMTALYTMVFVYDYDDHILRSKESTAFGLGYGFAAALSLRFSPEPTRIPAGGAPRFFFEIEGEYAWNRTHAAQRQYWYEDSDRPEGTEIDDVPHTITSSIGKASIGFGFAF